MSRRTFSPGEVVRAVGHLGRQHAGERASRAAASAASAGRARGAERRCGQAAGADEGRATAEPVGLIIVWSSRSGVLHGICTLALWPSRGRLWVFASPMTAAIDERRPRVLHIGDRGRRLVATLARPAYALYTRRLRREVQAAAAPRHLAVILDGNRRWAAGEGLRDAGAGHRRGADKIDELLDWCAPLGIEEITLWALSNENLGRPGSQLSALFDVVCDKLDALEQRALQPDTAMRMRVIGRSEDLPERVAATIRRIEQSTARQPGPSLTIALGYSGRDELIDACKTLVLSLAEAGVPAAAHRRGDHARVARGAPLYRRRARSRPHHPHER